MSFEVAEHTFGELHSGQRDGHRPRAYFSFDAHALADFQRALENTIQHWPSGAMVKRLIVSGAQLSKNFRFAEQHRIEARGNAEKMPHSVGSGPAIEAAFELAARDAM